MALALVKQATLEAQLKADGFEAGARRVETAAKGMTDAVGQFEKKQGDADRQTRLTAEGFQKYLERIDPATRAGRQYSVELDRLDRFQQAGLVSTQDLAIAQGALKQRFEDTGKSVPSDELNKLNSIIGFLRNSLGALGISFGIAQIVSFGKAVFDSTAQLRDQATMAGVDTNALQAYRNAMLDNGAASDIADRSLARLNDRIGSAVAGSKEAQDAFKKFGITSEDTSRGAAAVFALVAQRANAMGDASQRVAALDDLLGDKLGRFLLPALNDVAKGVDDLTAAYERQGRIIDESVIKKAKEIEDRFTIAAGRFKASWAPVFTWFAEQVANMTTVDPTLEAPPTVQELNRRRAEGRFGSQPLPEVTITPRVASPMVTPWIDLAAQEQALKRAKDAAEDYWKTVDELRKEDSDALSQFHSDQEDRWNAYYQKETEDAVKYWEDVDRIRAENNDKADKKFRDDQLATKQQVEDLWDDYYKRQAETSEKTAEESERRMAAGIEGMLQQVERTGKFNFRSLFAFALDEWNRTIAKMVAEWIQNIGKLSSPGGGGGGLFGLGLTNLPTLFNIGSIFGGGGSLISPGGGLPDVFITPQARASGGPVSAGMPYNVGENGPERFVPRTSGYIVPNSGMGGGNVNYITIDARGATPGMEQKLLQAAEVIAETVYRKNAPSTVAASVRTVNVSRKNMGRT